MLVKLLLIAGAGGVGSVLRHLLAEATQQATGGGYPWGTLGVNVSGCLLIAVLHALFATAIPVREEVRLAVLVGLLGGFTTFSSYGIETLGLLRDGRHAAAAGYVALSNVAGLGAAAAGYWLTHSLTAAPAT